MGDLKIWHNGFDWVIAESAEAAHVIACGSIGEKPEDYSTGDWKTWPEDKPISIREDEGGSKVRLPAGWIASEGRGWLCSTEY